MSRPVVTRTDIDSVNWTPILAPEACDYLAFYAEDGTDVTLRTNASDPSTEKTLRGGVQETFVTPPSRFRADSRFAIGDVVYYAKAASGTDVIVATWNGS